MEGEGSFEIPVKQFERNLGYLIELAQAQPPGSQRARTQFNRKRSEFLKRYLFPEFVPDRPFSVTGKERSTKYHGKRLASFFQEMAQDYDIEEHVEGSEGEESNIRDKKKRTSPNPNRV